MSTRRIAMAAMSGVLMSALSVAPAGAAGPKSPPGEAPLTAEQRAASDRKIAAAQAYLSDVAVRGVDLVSLQCVTPTGNTSQAGTNACYVPQGYLPVEARDQINGFYCGPAVGQVIANYSWAVGAGGNKYTQTRIAGWMGTDLFGGTSSQNLANGLEAATRGAPRRPAVWQWVVSPLGDSDRDGHTGDELQGFVRANVSGSKMPLAFSLKPHDPNSRYHLVSWPRPVVSVGHWISIYGWYSNFTGSETARIYYTDSSKDEGGGTGKYWDPTLHIAAMIREHTRVFVW
ncbi:MAG TPA: hypothetical protein VEW95_11555 [Candidatus Limnocylindrales bacterium]|nr:hypothetical protein [Candidatus Limnocylindrales bacterium]